MHRRVLRAILAMAFLVPVATVAGRGPSLTPIAFSGGASSLDRLIDEFLGALARKDGDALARLRVDEREYRTVILPGNHSPEATAQPPSARESEFAWSLLNTKSLYAEAALLDRFGGQRLRVKALEFAQGTHPYAGFTAHQKLRLTLEDQSGREAYLNTGSVAERGGTYKFVSFIRD